MTIPGIDMVVAVGLIAATGPIARFASPDRLVAYLGLNPRVHQSGEGRPRHGRITKQGRSHARTMLVEAAWQAVRGPGPLRAFFQRLSARRGPRCGGRRRTLAVRSRCKRRSPPERGRASSGRKCQLVNLVVADRLLQRYRHFSDDRPWSAR